MANVIVFGVLDTAELALWYLTHDSSHTVVAFTVHEAFLEDKTFHNLPVVRFEDIECQYPPSEFSLFIPMMGQKMNTLREKIFLEGKLKGYSFISYISSKATVCTERIGENCFILEDNTIQPYVSIGDNVVMWSGNHIGHHSTIHSHVFFTSHVVLSGHCIVESYSYFGVNSTIRDFSRIKEGTFLGMGAMLVLAETEPWTMWYGSPAKLQKHFDRGNL